MPDMRSRWAAFRNSVYLPAVVLVLLLTAGAGLFAGSYTYAMAKPAPDEVPIAVIPRPESPEQDTFLVALQGTLDASLDPRSYPSYRAARVAIEEQEVYAVLRARGGVVELDVASAAGRAVARLLTDTGQRVANRLNLDVRISDLKPLQRADPRGLALFYITLAAVIIGFVGAMNLRSHAEELPPPGRLAFTATYAVTGSFAIVAMVTWPLNAIELPFLESWATLALTAFTTGMVATMFTTLLGRWGILPTWALLVLIGNPSSGGVVSWPLLPFPFSQIGPWLPAGAAVQALHTAVYFPEHQDPMPFLVLAAWAVVCSGVFWLWRHHHPKGVLIPRP